MERMGALHGVLVTYRRGEQLKDYFDALARQTRSLDSLVVVDNDVHESARSIVDDHGLRSTKVEYLVSGDNIGPAGGIALGMRHVLEDAADDDWILTLDDDDPPRTAELIETLERFADDLRRTDPHVGGVGLCGGRFDASSWSLPHRRGRRARRPGALVVGRRQPVPVLQRPRGASRRRLRRALLHQLRGAGLRAAHAGPRLRHLRARRRVAPRAGSG